MTDFLNNLVLIDYNIKILKTNSQLFINKYAKCTYVVILYMESDSVRPEELFE